MGDILPGAIEHYTGVIWNCVQMAEFGIPMSRSRLEALDFRLQGRTERCHLGSLGHLGLPLEGDGSGSAKVRFMELACDILDGVHPCESPASLRSSLASETSSPSNGTATYGSSTTTSPTPEPSSDSVASSVSSSSAVPSSDSPRGSSVRDDPQLQLTAKQKLISFSNHNRTLLRGRLPKRHPVARALALADRHSHDQKLRSSYTFPLLYHKRNKPSVRDAVLVPSPGAREDTWLGYPTWFITPGPFKDGGGGEGGTKQGRITCKNPAAQTFPPQIKRLMQSRFEDGCIAYFDLSQIELRVAALLSGDHSMVSIYQEGGDIHSDMTLSVFGEDIGNSPEFGTGDMRTDPRQWGKTTNFLILYRGKWQKLQATLQELSGREFPEDFCRGVVDKAWEARQGLWSWQEHRILEARNTGLLSVPITGQSRSFRGGEKFEENEMVNFPVQTIAGNVLLSIHTRLRQTALALTRRNAPIRPFLNVYDAIIFDLRRDLYPELEAAFRDAVLWVQEEGYWSELQELTGHRVPIEFESKIVNMT